MQTFKHQSVKKISGWALKRAKTSLDYKDFWHNALPHCNSGRYDLGWPSEHWRHRAAPHDVIGRYASSENQDLYIRVHQFLSYNLPEKKSTYFIIALIPANPKKETIFIN